MIIIAQKIYSDQGYDIITSLDLLRSTFIAPLEEHILQTDKKDSNYQIAQLMEVLKDEYMVEILSCVHKTLIPYYMFYAQPKTALLTFNAFTKFCLDFGIFPDILSKSKIMRFFSTLSGFYQQNAQESTGSQIENTEVIDEHLFVEALALTAFEVKYRDPEPSNAEKIVLLIERMNTSEGPAKIQMSYGRTRFGHGETTNDLVFFFRNNYPELFEKRDIYSDGSRSKLDRRGKNSDCLDGLFDKLILDK
jgi:hypothetical protein